MSGLTVLYDADCGVCRHTARTLRALDRGHRLQFEPLQDFSPAAPGDPTRSELEAALHVRDERGTWHAGGEAALEIARVIPVLFPLWLVGRLPGVGGLAEWAYAMVARNRHAIGAWLGVDRCTFDPSGGRQGPDSRQVSTRRGGEHSKRSDSREV